MENSCSNEHLIAKSNEVISSSDNNNKDSIIHRIGSDEPVKQSDDKICCEEKMDPTKLSSVLANVKGSHENIEAANHSANKPSTLPLHLDNEESNDLTSISEKPKDLHCKAGDNLQSEEEGRSECSGYEVKEEDECSDIGFSKQGSLSILSL